MKESLKNREILNFGRVITIFMRFGRSFYTAIVKLVIQKGSQFLNS